MHKADMIMAGGGVALVLVIVTAPLAVTYEQAHYNERTLTCHVTDKDRGGKDSEMRVYTSCGVFIDADSTWRNKYNSADIFSEVNVGKTQTFRVVGWRNGFLSDFPNILEVK